MRRGRPLFQNFFFGFPGTNVVTVDITGLVCPKGCPTFVPEVCRPEKSLQFVGISPPIGLHFIVSPEWGLQFKPRLGL